MSKTGEQLIVHENARYGEPCPCGFCQGATRDDEGWTPNEKAKAFVVYAAKDPTMALDVERMTHWFTPLSEWDGEAIPCIRKHAITDVETPWEGVERQYAIAFGRASNESVEDHITSIQRQLPSRNLLVTGSAPSPQQRQRAADIRHLRYLTEKQKRLRAYFKDDPRKLNRPAQELLDHLQASIAELRTAASQPPAVPETQEFREALESRVGQKHRREIENRLGPVAAAIDWRQDIDWLVSRYSVRPAVPVQDALTTLLADADQLVADFEVQAKSWNRSAHTPYDEAAAGLRGFRDKVEAALRREPPAVRTEAERGRCHWCGKVGDMRFSDGHLYCADEACVKGTLKLAVDILRRPAVRTEKD